MVFNKDIHRFQNNIYDIVVYITWILYIVIALGLSANAPQYLDDLQYYIKLYISLFLIIRFNPLRRVRFTGLDAKIAFSAGVFLLGTMAVDSVLKNYLNVLKQYLPLIKINR
jgi:hypothetical protein